MNQSTENTLSLERPRIRSAFSLTIRNLKLLVIRNTTIKNIPNNKLPEIAMKFSLKLSFEDFKLFGDGWIKSSEAA